MKGANARLDSVERRYYKWRVFSLAQGDTLRRWRTDPFVMIAGGLRWTPPRPEDRPAAAEDPPAVVINAAAVAAAEGPGGAKLSEDDAEAFADILRGLTIERRDIAEGMAFAMDRASCAHDIADMLAESLTIPETPVPRKVARLFLVSDILHNCGAPVKHASLYRAALQDRLPRVFEALEETHRGLSGRITREGFRRRVVSVTTAWSDWFLFADEYVKGLEATFLRGGDDSFDGEDEGKGEEGKDEGDEEAGARPAEGSERDETDEAKASVRSDEDREGTALRAEIDAMDPEELRRACRARGLVHDEGPEACARRLIRLETFVAKERARRGGA